MWAHRILLESYKHGDSCFATLTYNDENLPKPHKCKKIMVGNGSLCICDYQKWLKRIRQAIAPTKIRFYLAGEYGDDNLRPHYHVALFGLPSYVAGGEDGCGGVVADTWGKGYTYVGDLNWESAQYIAKYVTKGPDHRNEIRTNGLRDEFSRMSLRPGIGASSMEDVSSSLSNDVGLDEIARVHDVPNSLMHGLQSRPLGRYLRRKLRGKMGFAKEDTPEEATKMYVLRLRAEHDEARATNPKLKGKYGRQIILDMNRQKINNLLAKARIRKQKESL